MPSTLDNKKNYKEISTVYLAVVALSLIRALGTYIFLIPNNFAPGGLTGLSTILYNVVKLYNSDLAKSIFNPGVTIFIFNIPLIIIALLKLNKKFAIRTTVCVLCYSAFLAAFTALDMPAFVSADKNGVTQILSAAAGGVVCGAGLGLMLRMNMSLAGTEIIGRLIYKKNPVADMQWIIFLLDSLVVVTSGIVAILTLDKSLSASNMLVIILTPIFFSFIALFLSSKVADAVLSGFKSSLEFHIITEKSEEISDAIVKTTHRGVTIIEGEGYYTHTKRKILLCIVKNKQINQLKRIIKETDPEAFVWIIDARQVTGKGFEIIDVD